MKREEYEAFPDEEKERLDAVAMDLAEYISRAIDCNSYSNDGHVQLAAIGVVLCQVAKREGLSALDTSLAILHTWDF